MFNTCTRLIAVCVAGIMLTLGLQGTMSPAAAEPSQPRAAVEWFRDYGSSSRGEAVIPTSDGGYLTVGSITEKEMIGQDSWQYVVKAYIIKTDVEGQPLWEQKLDHYSSGNAAYRVIETRDGGYLVAGTYKLEDGKPIDKLYLIRLDASGQVLWHKAVEDGPFHHTPVAIVETDDGSFMIAGRGMFSASAYEKGYILKVDSNGEKLWYRDYRFIGSEFFADMIPASDGGYIVIGGIGYPDYEPGDEDAMLMMKLDEQGDIVWSRPFQEPNTKRRAFSIISSDDGGYLVGNRKKTKQGEVTILTKTDVNGQPEWEKTYTAPSPESFRSLVRTKDGYALLGTSMLGESSGGKWEYAIVTFDVNGVLTSSEVLPGPPLSDVGKAAIARDGGFIFTGTVKRGEVWKLQLMKLTPFENMPPTEQTLASISFMEKEMQVKSGTSMPTVLQAVYGNGMVSDISGVAVYSSGDFRIADIDASGRVTGHEPGVTYIGASYGGLNASLKVTVLPEDWIEPEPARGDLRLDSNDYSLSAGSMIDVRVILYDYSVHKEIDVTKEATFRSANPDILECDDEGNLIGRKAGFTKIHAAYRGLQATSNVQVLRASVPQEVEQSELGL